MGVRLTSDACMLRTCCVATCRLGFTTGINGAVTLCCSRLKGLPSHPESLAGTGVTIIRAVIPRTTHFAPIRRGAREPAMMRPKTVTNCQLGLRQVALGCGPAPLLLGCRF